MSSAEARVTVNGIGGINHADVELPPGLTVLSGQNATNRTSLLKAINAALGGEKAFPNASMDGNGEVELTLGDETYSRTVVSDAGGTTQFSGEPYTRESELVDLFATLTSDNEIRATVSRGATSEVNERLRDLLMRPVDDDEIQHRIDELRQERDAIRERIREIEEKRERLPALTEKERRLENELETVKEKLDAKEKEIEKVEIDRGESEEAEKLLKDLRDARDTADDIEQDIRSAEQLLETAQQERDELHTEIEELEAELADMEEVDKARLNSLRERKNRMETVEQLLTQAQQANRRITKEDGLPDELQVQPEDVTEKLMSDAKQAECWACGSRVSPSAFDEQTEKLRDIRSDYRSEIREVGQEIESMKSQMDEKEQKQGELRTAESRLAQQEETIEQLEEKVERLEGKLEDQQDVVQELEVEVEKTEELRDHEIVDHHEEARELSNEEGRIERDLESTREEIRRIKNEAEDEDALKNEADRISEEMEDLNSKVHRLERRAVDTLQNHLDNLVDLLDYENIARVRIDRTVPEDRRGTASFVLSVVRETDGAVREDELGLQSLSESERSLVGLVTALAGYQTHDVEDEVPMILLDSIEEFDVSRLNRLIMYIMDEVPRVVAALLPEDATEVKTDCATVSTEGWYE